jgi:dTDP-glucose pyrophosphorylase
VRVVELTDDPAALERAMRATGESLAVVCAAQRFLGVVYRERLAQELCAGEAAKGHEALRLSPQPMPVMQENSTPLDIRVFLAQHDVPVVPFVDRSGHLTRLLDRDEALQAGLYGNAAVVMAGGYGVRLRPLTSNIPKPLVPLGQGTLLSRVLDHLLDSGIHRFYVAVHYMKEQVMRYLGDPREHGVELEYLVESEPQGTAGSLRSLIGREQQPVIVTNGDVITNQRLGEVLRFHRSQQAQLTVVCKEEGVDITYGVVERGQDDELLSITEKPRLSYLISTGIYIVEPDVLRLVPEGRCHMTELITRVKEAGGRVSVFTTQAYWRDVATYGCYAQVMDDASSGLLRPLRSLWPAAPTLNSLNHR